MNENLLLECTTPSAFPRLFHFLLSFAILGSQEIKDPSDYSQEMIASL